MQILLLFYLAISATFLVCKYKNKCKNYFEIKHNYLTDQFKDYKDIFKKIEKLILSNEFTLGKPVSIFEAKIKCCNYTKFWSAR